MAVQGVFLKSVADLPQWPLMRIAQSRLVKTARLQPASGLGFFGWRRKRMAAA